MWFVGGIREECRFEVRSIYMSDYIIELHVTMVIEAENAERAKNIAVGNIEKIPEAEDVKVTALFE